MTTKKILSVSILVAIIAFIGYSIFTSSTSNEAISVRTATISKETIVETLSTTGIIKPNQTQEIIGQGLVSEVDVVVGDLVEEDDRLVLYQDGSEKRAEFKGTITAVNLSPEEVDLSMQTGESAIVLADLTNLLVAIQLTKSDAPRVKKEQVVTLTSGSKTYQGKVTQLDPTAKVMSGQFGNTAALSATIAFDEASIGLFAGFDIDTEIVTETAKDVLSLPIESLLYNAENKPYVYLVEDGIAKAQLIEVGTQSDTAVEVKGGLEVDQTIILSPDEKVKDGIAVSKK
ncbi:HlyD family secretion protein [Carnobacterium iners]|uniref:HlyD family secretion protein n=1 Tax=Carnobacterium iners TaxID=1073423 RepID=A0A1X7N4I9_9LACT|nr:HlyD family efflux transporter periplasmic adaptor subunit [Carnobacterium iners]SEK60821.1 HlyD family secretion protein [Carnobacterium iners]SMH32253.1 HlyD family secretion protein [Carnobacterium iners]